MTKTTKDGSIQAIPSRSGITLATLTPRGKIQQSVSLTWEDAAAAHDLLGRCFTDGHRAADDSGKADQPNGPDPKEGA